MIRKIFFWTHLVSGLVAGLVIALLALSGLALSFEPQIIDWMERDIRRIPVAATDAETTSIEELMKFIREEHPDARPAGFTVYSDPRSAIVIPAGRGQTYYADPYTTAIKEAGSAKLRGFFNFTLSLHRYLALPGGTRGIGGQITGIATSVFLALSVTGLVIWWPRKWNWRSIKPSVWFVGAKGKLREWNWHNVIGLWTAPLLIIVCVTGLMMSYRWVGNLSYVLTGNPVPPARGQAAPGSRETSSSTTPTETTARLTNSPSTPPAPTPTDETPPAAAAATTETSPETTDAVTVPPPAPGARPLRYAALLATVRKTYPDWTQITLRPAANPRQGRPAGANRNASPAAETPSAVAPAESATRENRQGGERGSAPRTPRILPAVTMIVRTSDMRFSTSSITVSLDPYTGEILRAQGFADQNLGRRIRALAKPVHMGLIAGWPTQLLAAIASIGTLFLVYTGFALSWRRFFGQNARAKRAKAKTKIAS